MKKIIVEHFHCNIYKSSFEDLESDKNSRKHITQESQEVSPFPAGDQSQGCMEQPRPFNKDKHK